MDLLAPVAISISIVCDIFYSEAKKKIKLQGARPWVQFLVHSRTQADRGQSVLKIPSTSPPGAVSAAIKQNILNLGTIIAKVP